MVVKFEVYFNKTYYQIFVYKAGKVKQNIFVVFDREHNSRGPNFLCHHVIKFLPQSEASELLIYLFGTTISKINQQLDSNILISSLTSTLCNKEKMLRVYIIKEDWTLEWTLLCDFSKSETRWNIKK